MTEDRGDLDHQCSEALSALNDRRPQAGRQARQIMSQSTETPSDPIPVTPVTPESLIRNPDCLGCGGKQLETQLSSPPS
jgi:hypothetical protein